MYDPDGQHNMQFKIALSSQNLLISIIVFQRLWVITGTLRTKYELTATVHSEIQTHKADGQPRCKA